MKNKSSVARPGGRAPLLENRKGKMAGSSHAYPQEPTAEHLRATRERAFKVWRDVSKIAAAF
jgi:hypothetical protein